MKVTFKFLNLGINNCYQARIKIYDCNNNLIIDKYTYNGNLTVKLKKNKRYKLKAYFLNEVIYKCFCTNKYIDTYIYYFNHSILNTSNNIVTFLLTDLNYQNLPIEKGMINLWQNQ